MKLYNFFGQINHIYLINQTNLFKFNYYSFLNKINLFNII